MDVDVFTIRRMNLERLLQPFEGHVRALAERLGDSPSQVYLTQVLSAKTQRRMGAEVARRIERKMDLPPGWMDLINTPISDLSDQAVEAAQKLDKLPQSARDRIVAEIDTLYRYTREG